jgi:ribosomal protein L7/L12
MATVYAEVLQECHTARDQGVSTEQIVALMRDRGLTIAEAIKASVAVFGVSLGDAKDIVSSNAAWSDIAVAAEPLHNELHRLFEVINEDGNGRNE